MYTFETSETRCQGYPGWNKKVTLTGPGRLERVSWPMTDGISLHGELGELVKDGVQAQDIFEAAQNLEGIEFGDKEVALERLKEEL